MFYMVNITWPSRFSVKIGRKYIEGLDKSFPHVTRGPVYVTAGGEGIKGYAVFETEKGCGEEGLKGILQALSPLLDMEGCKFTLEPVLPVEETSSFVGIDR
ncbi:MAG: hypothetical protein IBX68_02285 [Dehalococcoidia bacterium]|nr:hypothetical protein [Dehalococcoidia bacterium]